MKPTSSMCWRSFRSAVFGGERVAVVTTVILHLRLHVREAVLLGDANRHDVRRDQVHARIEARNQFGTDVGRGRAGGLSQLPGDGGQGDVALPEYRAARLERFDACWSAVEKDVPDRRLLRC